MESIAFEWRSKWRKGISNMRLRGQEARSRLQPFMPPKQTTPPRTPGSTPRAPSPPASPESTDGNEENTREEGGPERDGQTELASVIPSASSRTPFYKRYGTSAIEPSTDANTIFESEGTRGSSGWFRRMKSNYEMHIPARAQTCERALRGVVTRLSRSSDPS